MSYSRVVEMIDGLEVAGPLIKSAFNWDKGTNASLESSGFKTKMRLVSQECPREDLTRIECKTGSCSVESCRWFRKDVNRLRIGSDDLQLNHKNKSVRARIGEYKVLLGRLDGDKNRICVTVLIK